MAIDILQITSANASLLESLAPDVFDNAIDPSQLQAFLEDPRHILIVAADGGVVVGMLSAVEYFHPDKQPHLWVNEVGVTPSHRRRGIGRSLVQASLDEARARGCVFAWLGTDVSNVSGQACFGSVPNGEEPEEFVLYEWDLTAEP